MPCSCSLQAAIRSARPASSPIAVPAIGGRGVHQHQVCPGIQRRQWCSGRHHIGWDAGTPACPDELGHADQFAGPAPLGLDEQAASGTIGKQCPLGRRHGSARPYPPPPARPRRSAPAGSSATPPTSTTWPRCTTSRRSRPVGSGSRNTAATSAPVIAAATATTSAPASEPQAHAAGAVNSCASDANGSVVHAVMERHYVQDRLESTSGARRLLHFVLFLSPCLHRMQRSDQKGGDRRVQDFAAAFGLAFALIGAGDPDLIRDRAAVAAGEPSAVALACLLGMPLGACLAVVRFPGPRRR